MNDRSKKRLKIAGTEIVILCVVILLLILLIQWNNPMKDNLPSLSFSNQASHSLSKKESVPEQRFPREQPEREDVIYLTFDDGPNQNSEAILNLLNDYNAKATFFMLEPQMKRYKGAVRRMSEEGHSVGLHGVSHDQSRFYASKHSVLSEMNQAQHTLHSITGKQSHLIRTPYGSVPNMTPAYRRAVKQQGYHLWDWNIDSKDWEYKDKRYVQKVINKVNMLCQTDRPMVVLMHERQTTLEHLDVLLSILSEQGFTFKAVQESMEPVQFQS
ncbi:polysaccharide deacetylase family protein [Pontibacillus salicampi]|uniref:Polysaccharide deacetylase family protein n=1 Tax=Pontibacillus salicampi TaxID=1449801 RepID=A0ABV6LI61_9BACI